MPSCVVAAVENGDPSKGASTLVFKATPSCKFPWHWHTPTEQVMMVSGSAKVEMKGGSTAVIGPGGYAMMPSKHIHQFTCVTACTAFVHSDTIFDMHYVDAAGKEIPPETALVQRK
ncbi:MAG: cupin domain-containing protein [Acidobacteriota bacterium]